MTASDGTAWGLRRSHQLRALLGGAVVLVVAGLAVGLRGDPVGILASAFAALDGASPAWLAGAGTAFLAASVASALAWHQGLGACGATLGRSEVVRRYAAGSLANTLAPANAGDAVRVALLSRAMGSEGAVFAVIGVSALVALARACVVVVLFLGTTPSGFPSHRVVVAAIAAVAVLGCGLRLVRARLGGKARHMLDAARGLAARPAAAFAIVAWVATCTGATIAAAACVGAALGVPHPVAAALVIVPAVEPAKTVPLTPGNVGLTSAAVALALRGRGVPLEPAIAAGITLHAVETCVGLMLGAVGTLSLTSALRRPRPRAWIHGARYTSGTGFSLATAKLRTVWGK